ncbi:MAG: hypothetical protein GTO53_02460 [Planctomycetales bacterium]|nr:hypothetical protein [Planctomycetales bacterium]NIM08031.1 hypothetical protein [Planctomycetales bacterium]NIN07522.1 hypothetical protein [Planctomycetales bacterium]NIN76629.1 hypothetical protein [Planctomycetales bacterium]NIO33816.1 hypothetical protein [Planctomycetales bacterium]
MKARFYLAIFWACFAPMALPQGLCAEWLSAGCLTDCSVSSCETIYTWQPVTTYRQRWDVVYEEREVTRYCPVWETQIRECRYQVLRPETETVYHKQRYTVVTPVWETQMHDASYDQIRHICETHYQEQKCTVMRAVTKTENRTQRLIVKRLVTETVEEDVQQTRWQPVTTYQSQVVDQGSFQTQLIQKEKWAPHCLRWAPAGWGIDPASGKPRYQLAGLAWQKKPSKIKTVSRQVWVPNPVTVQVPQTTYQQVVETVKVPRQLERWVEEEVEQTVPVTVQELVPEEQVRQVPVTVTRQVVERIERQIPVRVCRQVTEQRERVVPVSCTRLVREERVEQVPVRVCKYIAKVEKVRLPRVIRTCVPVVEYRCTPCKVISHVSEACCGSAVTMPMVVDTSCCGVSCAGPLDNGFSDAWQAPLRMSPVPAVEQEGEPTGRPALPSGTPAVGQRWYGTYPLGTS